MQIPEERQLALRFRAQYTGRSFWCGAWLGGCGRRLTTRVGMERIAHFAHIPVHPEPHVCRRRYTEADSADHLYILQELERWLAEQGARVSEVKLLGDPGDGESCREAAITTRTGDTRKGPGRITMEIRATPAPTEQDSAGLLWENRLYGPKAPPPNKVIRRGPYTLRSRLSKIEKWGYRTEVGTVNPKGRVQWAGLAQCTLTERGITTPAMAQKKAKPSEQRMRPEQEVGATPGWALSRLPLDVDRITVYPRKRGSTSEKKSPTGQTIFLLPVDVESAEESGRQTAFLWSSEPIRKVKRRSPYRLASPAWIEVPFGQDRWHLHSQTITPAEVITEPPRDLNSAEAGEPSASDRQVLFLEEAPEVIEQAATLRALADPGPVFDVLPTPRFLIGWVAEIQGSPLVTPFLQRWITLGMTHESRARQVDGMAEGHLRALRLLERLGERWLDAFLLDLFTARFICPEADVQRQWLEEARTRVQGRIASRPFIREGALLAAEQELVPGSPKHLGALATVVRQLLGILVLHGLESACRALVEHAYRECTNIKSWREVGWASILDDRLGPGGYTIECRKTPQASTGFYTATLRDREGNTARGGGGTERKARSRAARSYAEANLLLGHGWRTTTGIPRRKSTNASGEVPKEAQRRVQEGIPAGLELSERTVERLHTTLGHILGQPGMPEDIAGVTTNDRELLQHYGSVLGKWLGVQLAANKVFQRKVDLEEGESEVPEARPEELWSGIMRALYPEAPLLLEVPVPEKNQALAGEVTTEVASETAGNEAAESPQEPAEPSADITDIEVEKEFLDLCSLYGLTWSLRMQKETGDPAGSRAILELSSGERVRGEVTGPHVQGGLEEASAAVVRELLEVAERTRRVRNWNLSAEQAQMARLMLRIQAGTAPALSAEERSTCLEQRHLGLDFLRAGRWGGFEEWAEEAERAAGGFSTAELQGLSAFYGAVAKQGGHPVPPALRQVCAWLAKDVHEISWKQHPPVSTQMLARGLTQFAELLRVPRGMASASGVLDATRSLPDVAPVRIAYGPLEDPGGKSAGRSGGISFREAQALAFLVRIMLVDLGIFDRTGGAQVTQSRSETAVRFRGSGGGFSRRIRPLIDLVLEAFPSFALNIWSGDYTVTVTRARHPQSLGQVGSGAWRHSIHQSASLEALVRELGPLTSADRGRIARNAKQWTALKNSLIAWGQAPDGRRP